jgi:cobalt-zinc-cadmium efflux system outer membrane protein
MARWMIALALLTLWTPRGARAQPPRVSIDGRPMSLAALLRHAEDHAPALAVARAEVGLADEAFGAAEPLLPANPELLLGVGPRMAANGGSDANVLASLLVPLEIAGERPLRFDVARAARARRERALDAVRWELRTAIAEAYRLALVRRRDAALAAQLARFAERLREAAGRRVEAGDAPPLTHRVAAADAARARQARIAAVQRYRDACLRLAALAGWSAARPPEPTGELPDPRAPPPLARLLEAARAHNPQLRHRRAALAEARTREMLAAREAWPEPAVGARYIFEGSPEGGAAEHVLMGLISLPFPVAQRNQAARARAAARAHIARAELEGLEAALAARLAQRRSAVEAAAARVRAFGEEILPSFEANLEELRRAFELGEIDLATLSFAVDRFLSARREALDAHAAYATAVAALQRLLGQALRPATPSRGSQTPE